MSDLVNRLKAIDYQMLGSTKTSPKRTIYFEAANLIEQQQQQIAELETQVRSIALSRDELAATVSVGVEAVCKLIEGRDFDVSLMGSENVDNAARWVVENKKLNLNKLHRRAFINGYLDAITDCGNPDENREEAEYRANQRYPDKE